MLKIMRNMVMHNKFKYFGKIIKNGAKSVITNSCTVAFLKIGTTAACFHKVGNLCCDKLRLKIDLRTGTDISEQPLIKNSLYCQFQQISIASDVLWHYKHQSLKLLSEGKAPGQ
jgi:hypothetical protein